MTTEIKKSNSTDTDSNQQSNEFTLALQSVTNPTTQKVQDFSISAQVAASYATPEAQRVFISDFCGKNYTNVHQVIEKNETSNKTEESLKDKNVKVIKYHSQGNLVGIEIQQLHDKVYRTVGELLFSYESFKEENISTRITEHRYTYNDDRTISERKATYTINRISASDDDVDPEFQYTCQSIQFAPRRPNELEKTKKIAKSLIGTTVTVYDYTQNASCSFKSKEAGLDFIARDGQSYAPNELIPESARLSKYLANADSIEKLISFLLEALEDQTPILPADLNFNQSTKNQQKIQSIIALNHCFTLEDTLGDDNLVAPQFPVPSNIHSEKNTLTTPLLPQTLEDLLEENIEEEIEEPSERTPLLSTNSEKGEEILVKVGDLIADDTSFVGRIKAFFNKHPILGGILLGGAYITFCLLLLLLLILL